MPELCNLCHDVAYLSRNNSITCDMCKKSYHYKCAHVDKNKLDILKSTPGVLWECSLCLSVSADGSKPNYESLVAVISELKAIIVDLRKDIDLLKNRSHDDIEVVIDEVNERRRKENNIMIYHLEEKNDETGDSDQARELIGKIAPTVNTDNIKTHRIGRSVRGSVRPLRIVLNSSRDVLTVLKNRRKLKELKLDVSIAADQTRMQRAYYKGVKAEMDERRGFLLWMCCWRPVRYLSRLTYSTFLVHTFLLRVKTASQRAPTYISDYAFMTLTLEIVTMGYIFGLILCITCEMPVSALQKLWCSTEKAEDRAAKKIIDVKEGDQFFNKNE